MYKKLKYIEHLDALNIPESEYIICGSGLLVVLGYIKENEDIDLLVTDRVYKDLVESGRFKKNVKHGCDMYTLIENDRIEFNRRFDALDMSFEEVNKGCVVIEERRYMGLCLLYEFYKKMGREKDLEKMEILDELMLSARAWENDVTGVIRV